MCWGSGTGTDQVEMVSWVNSKGRGVVGDKTGGVEPLKRLVWRAFGDTGVAVFGLH